MSIQAPSTTIHATSVCLDGRALLICGDSGTGKSALALQLVALGAKLLADDRTTLDLVDNRLQARCPPAISGLIEARGVGILRLPAADPAAVTLAVDLNRSETARLPAPHSTSFLGTALPCLWGASGSHFPAAVLHCLRHGISHNV